MKLSIKRSQTQCLLLSNGDVIVTELFTSGIWAADSIRICQMTIKKPTIDKHLPWFNLYLDKLGVPFCRRQFDSYGARPLNLYPRHVINSQPFKRVLDD